MNVKEIGLSFIEPYEGNPKTHPEKQIQAIAKSIKKFGFRQPIVIDKNNVIVAGHARYMAAMKLKLQTVPCEYADDLTEKEIIAYRILDNEIAKQGIIDDEILQLEIAKIPDFDFGEFNIEFQKFETKLNLNAKKNDEEEKDKCPMCGK